MKISNSKKQLAQIIHDNGGWPEGGDWISQDRDGGVYSFLGARPVRHKDMWCLKSSSEKFGWKFSHAGAIKNWHQTILSRAEYFHLHPAPDVKVSIAVENNTSLNVSVSAKPTIEQLAAEYHNRKDYAERKQEEADVAKADADAKLVELVAAGKAIGLALSVVAPESELVITDWRDLRVGDVVKITSVFERGNEDYCDVIGTDAVVIYVGDPARQDLVVSHDDMKLHIDGFGFIRRP